MSHWSELRHKRFLRTCRATLGVAAAAFLVATSWHHANPALPERLRCDPITRVCLIPPFESEPVSKKRRDPVRGALTDAAKKYGLSLNRFVDTAKCESNLDPNARSDSGTFLGVMQQHEGYWKVRAKRAGFEGASIYDPRANVFVAGDMIRNGGGWGHWPYCSKRGRR